MSASLAAVAELVPFLRSRRGEPDPEAGEVRAADLIDDPERFAALILATGSGRGSDDPQVLASLWWQSYCYRTAGTTLAAWVVAGTAPDPAATTGIGIATSRHRPSGLLVGPQAGEIDVLAVLVARLLDDHLDPLAASLRDRIRIGRKLLDGNLSASVASCLGALACADRAPNGIAARVDLAMAALPANITGLGRWEVPHSAYRRSTCCLWWKTSDAAGSLCADCSLQPGEPIGEHSS